MAKAQVLDAARVEHHMKMVYKWGFLAALIAVIVYGAMAADHLRKTYDDTNGNPFTTANQGPNNDTKQFRRNEFNMWISFLVAALCALICIAMHKG